MSAPVTKPKIAKIPKTRPTDDEIDTAEARKILADPKEERIPYDSIRKEAGLR